MGIAIHRGIMAHGHHVKPSLEALLPHPPPKAIEALAPDVDYLGLAVGGMLLSAGLVLARKKELGNLVGLLAPTLLVIGLYKKLMKVEREMNQRQAARNAR